MAKSQQQLTPLGSALAGALGGVFANSIVYPLDTVKTKVQADAPHKQKGKVTEKQSQISALSVLARIYKEDGIAGYYKGYGASMLNTFSMQYAYFFFYSLVRTTYIKRTTKAGTQAKPLSTAVELLLGALAGALGQIFTIPVAVIATRQQIGHSKTSRPTSQIEKSDDSFEDSFEGVKASDESFIGVAKEIIREDGVQGLWLGLAASLVLTVNPAITYGVFERVKSVFTLGDPKVKLSPWRAFTVGALSKTLATVVTYPYIMAKVRVQAGDPRDGLDNEHHHKHRGALDVLKQTYKTRGVIGWYQGMGAQIVKAVLAQALLFMSKDQFEHYALVIIIAWTRLTSAVHV